MKTNQVVNPIPLFDVTSNIPFHPKLYFFRGGPWISHYLS